MLTGSGHEDRQGEKHRAWYHVDVAAKGSLDGERCVRDASLTIGQNSDQPRMSSNSIEFLDIGVTTFPRASGAAMHTARCGHNKRQTARCAVRQRRVRAPPLLRSPVGARPSSPESQKQNRRAATGVVLRFAVSGSQSTVRLRHGISVMTFVWLGLTTPK